MVVIKSVGEEPPPVQKHADFREKFGECQCENCPRIFNEHTNEELDRCFDEMFPIMKLVHEKHAVEFYIPDKEYSPEERDALAHQIAYEVRNQSMAQIRKVIAALKAWQGGK